MDRVAIVSGATSGIGLKIVENLTSQGIFTIMLGRNEDKLKTIQQYLGETVTSYRCQDLMDTDLIQPCIAEIAEEYKNIDILVNCAGIGEFCSIEQLNIEELKDTINTNLIGTIVLTKAVASIMVSREKGQIINIESIAATKGFEYGTAYVTSKFGLAGFSQVLWSEMKKYEIKVCSIRPGLVNTNMFRNMHETHDLENALDPDDIAYLVDMVVNQSVKSNISVIEVRPVKREAQNLFYKMVKNEEEYKRDI